MKSGEVVVTSNNIVNVAPYTGAWIEIIEFASHALISDVAPYTGAWIEIETDLTNPAPVLTSPPIRGRGLK